MNIFIGIVLRGSRFFLLGFCVAIVSACGGGSGGEAGNEAPPRGSTPDRQNSNRGPVGRAIGERVIVQSHPVNLDMAGTFKDPDGDPLTFEIRFDLGNMDTPPGLTIDQGVVSGEPEVTGYYNGTVTATDPEGLSKTTFFTLQVVPNNVPEVVSPNTDLITSIGSLVNIDASKAGTAFIDLDGDSISYEVKLRGEPRGLSVSGTRVQGTFNSVGLVEVTVTANDSYGGGASDVFVIAAPAHEPGEPVLPATSYIYEDEELELPLTFLDSFFDSSPDDNLTTNAGATLGRVLFYDKRLSSTNTIACASCHQQAHGFADPERFSIGALGVPTQRNAMALGNVRFNNQRAWFWDMRAHSLQEQVLMPIQQAEEMGSSLPLLEAKLAATRFYPPLFEAAFGSTQVTSERISKALAQFLQAMLSYRSKFHRASTDPSSVLSAQELRGSEIFVSPGKCGMCHNARLLNNQWQANNGLDSEATLTDLGIQDGTFNRLSTGVFRAAALSNIAVTAPYMHDGRFATLREVIDHYDHNVQADIHVDFILRNLDGSPLRLNLSEEDKDALEAFLNTFTDTEFLEDPKFSDPF